jgi:hypothetical protein
MLDGKCLEQTVKVMGAYPSVGQGFDTRENLVWWTHSDNLSVCQHNQAVSFRRRGDLVLDHNQSVPLCAHLSQQGKYLLTALGVEVGRGFVKNEQSGPESENGRDCQPLLLSPRKGSGIARLESSESYLRKHLTQPTLHLGWGYTDLLHTEDDLIAHRGGKYLRLKILEHHADRAGKLADFFGQETTPEEMDGTTKVAGLEGRDDAIKTFY